MNLTPFPPRDQQIVDPAVASRKFEREVMPLLTQPDNTHRQGFDICEVAFPEIRIKFLAADGTPRLGGLIVARNYNYLPPSLIFTSLDWSEPVAMVPALRDILQGHPESGLTFVCLEGFLEYHEHQSHYNNPWDRHRGSAKGTLWYCMYQARRRLNF